MVDWILVCVAAVAGGAVNSVAGGGTLLTFPVLAAILGGSAEATVVASATSTVSLFPGSLASMWGYRLELRGSRDWVRLLIGPSLIGGFLGSVLLVALPSSTFKQLVPWLILGAALLFLLQPQIARWTGIGKPHEAPTPQTALGVAVFQFGVAIYGGYFGAGIGILMLSALAMMGLSDIHRMNGLKALLASAINAMSVVVFVGTGYVDWQYAAPMVVSSIIGGYGGAAVARRLNKTLVRNTVVAIGFALAAYYFAQQFGLVDNGANDEATGAYRFDVLTIVG